MKDTRIQSNPHILANLPGQFRKSLLPVYDSSSDGWYGLNRVAIVGFVEYSDQTKISVADIPGIISGAHNNRGLGLSFLRHIQRTRVLLYVVDVSDKVTPPRVAFREIQKELLHYDESLLRKPSIVVANKVDEEGAAEGISELRNCTKLPVVAISAKNGTNIGGVAEMIRRAYFSLYIVC